MFALTAANRYEYYAKPCDMRKGFDTLCGLVTNELGRKATCGDVFVFINKARNTIKLLHWEVDGLVIYHKRLEKGTFGHPQIQPGQSTIRWPELVLMLEGITATKLKRKPRFLL
ncbi:IS66 Orf2 like protein [Dyadobacter jejuensis]|uniref:IS66 Orf2 like protein n=1 Tax=Dyadobacter jejuensis TaxID=1082580 RepID=A0A316ARY7_9BACT|nr:IS66 family insertion sequence element accessory protein TnpB [Dyadobacter jejuensis]PWJ52857.1 IS66 Orf2 like protein [Dyadobacter jejuensis]